MNDHIEKVVKGNPEISGDDLKGSVSKVIKLMQEGIIKIEEEAINDQNLEEKEVVSILAATCAVQGMSNAISTSAQMFFENLSSSLNNSLQTRCWLCRVFKTVVNVVTTVVVSAVTFAWNTVVFGYNVVSNILEGDGWEGLGNSALWWVDDFGSFFKGALGWVGGSYDCYLDNDAWNCP